MGAEVEIAACDVSDREQLQGLLEGIPSERSLGAVIHAAGVLDDATIESLDPDRLKNTFAVKASAAQHLHELTKEAELSAFVMFSSAAATISAPGQGNYAAANAYLDALAQQRHAEGLPASSIAWGLWQRESGMAAGLGEADLARLARAGVAPLTDEQGLAFFDVALSAERPDTLAVGIAPAGLRAQAQAGMLPPMLSELVRIPRRHAVAAGPTLAERLAKVPEVEREALVMGLVRSEVATVLGHDSAEQVDPAKAFQDLGFDSLAAVELRNRLNAVTGMRLAATAVFDFPTPAAVAEHLLAEASGGIVSADTNLEQLTQALAAVKTDDTNRLQVAAQLRALAADLEGDGETESGDGDTDRLRSASDEELLEFIDAQVGSDGQADDRAPEQMGDDSDGR
jgi:acyl carrier protein